MCGHDACFDGTDLRHASAVTVFFDLDTFFV